MQPPIGYKREEKKKKGINFYLPNEIPSCL